jgi:glyoxylase-like metal-dependent hydrolase (beta-lactamase superfamily II)
MDYDPASSTTSGHALEPVLRFLSDAKLKPLFILETHAHADHLSGAQSLKLVYPDIQLAIGDQIRVVQRTFAEIFNFGIDFKADGSQFDRLLKDGEKFKAGSIEVEVVHTPGHTPACTTYRIGQYLFVGDLMFIPDSGTGRCDFPDGSATQLFKSIERLYRFPNTYLVFVGHDYQPNGRPLKFKSTIGEQKEENIHIRSSTSEAEFVKMRTERDRTLKAPKLLFPSIQVNIRAGKLPDPAGNGRRYLHIPIS